MDVDMEVDDLFGDDVGLALASTAQLPSSAFLQRVDEMRRTGCCRAIAWSPSGTIASITPDGQAVEFRFLRAHPDTGNWALSEPTIYCPWKQLPQGSYIVHLAWSAANNSELAIIDSFGRILVVVFNSNLNRPVYERKWDSDPLDDLHTIVGCASLMPPSQSKQRIAIAYGRVHRKGMTLNYPYQYVPHMGPSSPYPGKSAFVFVTANGTLKIFWFQVHTNRMEEKSFELESMSSSDDAITHASIASDRGTLLIALVTASKTLLLVRVIVSFAPLPDKQQPHQLQINLREERIAYTNWLQPGITPVSPLCSYMNQLSHLEVIPSICSNVQQGTWIPPYVYAVRTYIPGLDPSTAQEPQTIVDRWEVETVELVDTIHPAFDQLATKKGGVAPQQISDKEKYITRLKKLDPVIFHGKVLIDMTTAEFSKILILTFSDGSVQHRESNTFNEVFHDPTSDPPESFSSPKEIGFDFLDEFPCLQVAFSPSRLSYVLLGEGGKIKWNCIQEPSGIGASMNNPKYANTVGLLTTGIANCAHNSQSIDDILALARQFLDREGFALDLSLEIIKCLRVVIDYAEEAHHDKLLSNNNLVISFSVIAHLGFRGYFQPKTFLNKLATITLHTKVIILIITLAANAYQQQSTAQRGVAPLDDAYVVHMITGCAEWIRDLIAWIADGLFALAEEPTFTALLGQEKSMSEIAKYLTARSEISLHLCLCSMTRALLKAACRRLDHLKGVSLRAITHFERKSETRSMMLYESYKRMNAILTNPIVSWTAFEELLSALNGEIQGAYKSELGVIYKPGTMQGGGSQEETLKKARTQCEQLLLLGNAPPQFFQGILTNFFHWHLQQFRIHTKPDQLFFFDFSLVEIADDENDLATNKVEGIFVDVFKRQKIECPMVSKKKQELTMQSHPNGPQAMAMTKAQAVPEAKMPWRRCTRCASVMVDVNVNRQNVQYMLSQHKRCPCGGSWAILPRNSMIF